MKKISNIFCTIIIAASLFFAAGCSSQPNGDGNSTDTKNSNGEGAVDSSRLPGIRTDNSQMPDTSVNSDTAIGNR